jgi:hypothetical protein
VGRESVQVEASTNIYLDRECHGFVNPRGLTSRAVTGAGAGWQIATLEKPAPVVWV